MTPDQTNGEAPIRCHHSMAQKPCEIPCDGFTWCFTIGRGVPPRCTQNFIVKNWFHFVPNLTGSSKGTQASNVTGLGSPFRAVSKPALYSKSSLGFATATKRRPTRFSSSCDSSGGASPGNNSKSRSISTRKDIDSRTVDQSLGSAIPKTSSKIAWRKKTPSTSQISGGNENRVIGPSQNIKKASTYQTGIVSRPSSSSSSRLQMPSSPKIGIFSGVSFCLYSFLCAILVKKFVVASVDFSTQIWWKLVIIWSMVRLNCFKLQGKKKKRFQVITFFDLSMGMDLEHGSNKTRTC